VTTLAQQMDELGREARAAAQVLAQLGPAQKTRALHAAAASLRAHAGDILAANGRDMDAAAHLSGALRDRLMLDAKRIEGIARGIDQVADLPDPVGRVLEAWDVASNGLHIEKIAVPLGVIGMIYESRPNVTADATALAIKSGNAVILRGGSESFHSNGAILAAIHEGLQKEDLPQAAAQLVPTTDRAAVNYMLTMHDVIDVIIPRGGKSLTERVRADARVPTLLHLDANVHIYIDRAADAQKAQRILHNAKLRRCGVCGAVETLLIDRQGVPALAKTVIADLLDGGCEIRGDAEIAALDARVKPATDADWDTEYLAPILAVKMVGGLEDAIAHINRHSSHHTDAIITEDKNAAQHFTQSVDSAIVLVNASTQFADGGEFGFGGEIGIATGRLHARGPVGAAQLTTYKYVVSTHDAAGAIRAG
jgi:glutamate-5-semialdehyde dehydrogenase